MQVPDDLAQVGFVFGAYGVAGWVRVRPFSEDADALLSVKTWWIDKPGLRDVEVKQCKLHGGDVVAQLAGVTDRDMAEALKGAAVSVPRSRFPALSDDEFYWTELIGLDVENLQGEHLGTVTDMMSNGPQSILRIQPAATPDAEPEVVAQERLIPFVDAFVIKVDKAANKITVDWGLDY
ncbi:ribosome maturation factor RimM [Duganella sp. HSC-15S17]|uniref:Ribosome maturation factor RimM n=1 Tax=Duganella violaceipulchra TaxID=2849652 RepID=A0AA41H8B4_9BURK|nr:ribosome maturation factor RimM [Duganella violaceicalia]